MPGNQEKKKTQKRQRPHRDESRTKDNAVRNLYAEAREAERILKKLHKRGELTPERERRLKQYITDCIHDARALGGRQ